MMRVRVGLVLSIVATLGIAGLGGILGTPADAARSHTGGIGIDGRPYQVRGPEKAVQVGGRSDARLPRMPHERREADSPDHPLEMGAVQRQDRADARHEERREQRLHVGGVESEILHQLPHRFRLDPTTISTLPATNRSTAWFAMTAPAPTASRRSMPAGRSATPATTPSIPLKGPQCGTARELRRSGAESRPDRPRHLRHLPLQQRWRRRRQARRPGLLADRGAARGRCPHGQGRRRFRLHHLPRDASAQDAGKPLPAGVQGQARHGRRRRQPGDVRILPRPPAASRNRQSQAQRPCRPRRLPDLPHSGPGARRPADQDVLGLVDGRAQGRQGQGSHHQGR